MTCADLHLYSTIHPATIHPTKRGVHDFPALGVVGQKGSLAG